ncbi:MAG: hypothetical protein REI11_16640 [Patulibacter sp.]|nr:hypothetical protein [Patulibacter sp.]
MPDRPPENPGSSLPPFAGAPAGTASRSLSEILEELALVTNAHQGDASAMRGAVSELSRALARLFEMIRADRADQSSRIAELEHALQVARARVAELEGVEIAEDHAAPDPSDFDALRGAAARLRARTEEIVRSAGTPADEAARVEETPPPVPVELADAGEAERLEAARRAVEESIAAEALAAATESVEDIDDPRTTEAATLPPAPVHDEPFGQPGVLRVFPGAVLRKDVAEDLDIESELVFDEEPRRVAAAAPIPADEPPTAFDEPATPPVAASEPQRPALSVRPRPEPIPVLPRPARRRRGLRRRRIDARKLRGVDPAAALRAMVTSIDDLWTAGNPLDLVVALTDGGTLHVTGGDRVPLRVEDVPAGTSGRCTVTATSAQIVPLFGRLDLDDTQSAPLIHGSRRDADLLVGWIDRAQRIAAQPL